MKKAFKIRLIEAMIYTLLAAVFAVMIIGCTAIMVALYRYILM